MTSNRKPAATTGARRAKSVRKTASKRSLAKASSDTSATDAASRQAAERCAVVGLGPVVAGRVAFRQVLEAQPSEDGMAYVFIPRLEPAQERLLEDLLSSLRSADAQSLARAANLRETLRRRERQQAAAAELGQAALSGADLQALFDQAVRLVSEALETEFSQVLELLPEGRELRLAAGVGWMEGLVGTATVGTGLESQAGYTLQRAGPVIVEDLQTDKRFHGPTLLTDHGIVSGMSVVIGPPADPWGVLAAHTRQRVQFTVDDAHFLQSVANVLWDAIARQRAEEALRESEARRRLVKDALPVLIAYCDADCVYRFCNAAYEDWFGLDRNEVVGQRLADVIGGDAFAKVAPHIRRVLRGERVAFEQELPYKYGPSRHVDVTYIPHRDESAAVVGFYAMIEDVSDRKQFEQQLLDANNRLEAIVETAADGIITVDADGNIESANRAVSEMFGYTAGELLGQNVNLLMPQPHGSEDDEWLDTEQRSGEGRILCVGREVLGRRKDGTIFPLDLAVSEFTLGDQRRFTAILRDISERNHAVAERAMLEASERERRRIGQDLHDSLGQELTGLSLMAQNVADELRDARHPAAETAEILTRGLRNALQRVRRLSRGLAPIDEVDRRGLIVALENLAAQTAETGSAACRFECSNSIQLSHGATATHLYHIAQEAVANALKHAQATRIDVVLRQEAEAITLTIRDNGCGLPVQPRESAGMGLRIMRYRADRIRGTLAIRSQAGKGTTVVCTARANGG